MELVGLLRQGLQVTQKLLQTIYRSPIVQLKYVNIFQKLATPLTKQNYLVPKCLEIVRYSLTVPQSTNQNSISNS